MYFCLIHSLASSLGLVVTYDVSKTIGSRVVDVQIRCANCSVPVFEPLDLDQLYTIALPTFTANGGDGYTMIRDNKIRLPPISEYRISSNSRLGLQ